MVPTSKIKRRIRLPSKPLDRDLFSGIVFSTRVTELDRDNRFYDENCVGSEMVSLLLSTKEKRVSCRSEYSRWWNNVQHSHNYPGPTCIGRLYDMRSCMDWIIRACDGYLLRAFPTSLLRSV